MSIKTKFFKQLEQKVIGLEKQRQAIESVLLDFKSSSKGGSCVLSGRPGSGKSLLLDQILKEHFTEEEVIYEDGDLYANSNQPLKKLSELGLVDEDLIAKTKVNKSESKVIVIDHFEYFTSKKSQNFLYTLLNGTHQFPWFIIMIGISQDCVSVPPLEKRVYSRLSKSIISFNVRHSRKELFDAFCTFYSCFAECEDQNFQSLDIFKSTTNELNVILNRFFAQCRGLGMVKRLVVMFVIVFSLQKSFNDPFKVLRFCAESICPENDILPILKELPLRQLCLLNCFVLLQKTERKFEYVCRNVILEYKRFLHTSGSKSLYVDDSVLYKDLEELIALDVVTLKGGADIGELQFRKVILNVEEEALIGCFVERNLPIEVLQWINLL